MKNNTSPGTDKIMGVMIKHRKDCMIQEVHQLCNMAWTATKAPTEWFESITMHWTRKDGRK